MILTNKDLGDLWFNHINIGSPIDDDTIKELAKLYSNNFGFYSGGEKQIRLSTYRFLDLYDNENAYFCSNITGDILGYCTICNIYNGDDYSIDIITNLIVDKKYRKKGLAKDLLRYSILQVAKRDIENYIGIYTINPISLWIFDNIPGIKNIDLYECKSGIKKLLQNYFSDNKYKFINNRIVRSCNNFEICQNIELEPNGYNYDLLDWYNGLMGKLDSTDEWFLLAKIINLDELKFDN